MRPYIYTLFTLFHFQSFCQLSFQSFHDQEPEEPEIAMSIPGGFEENKGQFTDMSGQPAPHILFKKETGNIDCFITNTGATFVYKKNEVGVFNEKTQLEETALSWERIDLILEGAHISASNIIKENSVPGSHRNYFLGHCPNGIQNVESYSKIIIKDVYPRIDWVLYNTINNGYKHDFVLHHGANLNDIDLIYRSADKLELNDDGTLTIKTQHGTLEEKAPVSFLDGKKIKSRFILETSVNKELNGYDNHIRFEFDHIDLKAILESDTQHELIIDPLLIWDTYYGGNSDEKPFALEIDSKDNIYITGYSSWSGFPLFSNGNYFQGVTSASSTMIILKFDKNRQRKWATYYGGSTGETAHGMTIDINDNVFITGRTWSSDFPVKDNNTFLQDTLNGSIANAFIVKFDSVGNQIWSTYYGGDYYDAGSDVVCDTNGNVFVVGEAWSSDFPLQDAGTYFENQGQSHDAFILKFDNDGNRLWATYYGGSNQDKAVSVDINEFGEVYILGETKTYNFPLLNAGTFYLDNGFGSDVQLFILRFDNDGNRLWATCYGGTGEEQASTIKVDRNNDVIVLCMTYSNNFQVFQNATGYYDGTNNPGRDIGLIKFDRHGNQLWSTYFGGNSQENVISTDNIAVDDCNNLYIGFSTESNLYMPLVQGCFGYHDPSHNGNSDIFLTKFDKDCNLKWSTYFGGNLGDTRGLCSVNSKNNLIVSSMRFGCATPADLATYPLLNPNDGSYFDNFGILGEISVSEFSVHDPVSATLSSISDTCSSAIGSATVTLTGAPACNHYFVWNNGIIDTASNNSSTISGLTSGYYSVKVMSDCNLHFEDSVFVPVYNPLTSSLNLGTDTSICSNETLVLNPAVNNVNYTWQDGSNSESYVVNDEGIYWLIIDSAGCTETDSIQVNYLETPTTLLGNDTTICTNSILVLDAGEPTASHLWQDGSVNQFFTVTSPGIYWVENQIGNCYSTDSITVSNYPEPDINFAFNKEDRICVNHGIITLSVAPPGGTLSGTGLVNNSQFDPGLAGVGSHTLYYTYTDVYNCTSIDSVTIDVEACLDISELSALGVTVSPNPFSNYTQLSFNRVSSSGYNIVIHDMLGKVVFREDNFIGKSLIIFKGRFNNGHIYLIRSRQ